jgi:hypothetical protein
MNKKYQLVSEALSQSMLSHGLSGASTGAGIGAFHHAFTYDKKIRELRGQIALETDPTIKEILKKKLEKLLNDGRAIHALKGAGKGAVLGGSLGTLGGAASHYNKR